MKILWSNNVTWNNPKGLLNETNGYGYATDRIINSLIRLGHEVFYDDLDSDVHFWMDQPHHVEWSPRSRYKILFHPWESTKLKDDWVDRMNQTDEIWTPSPIIADWYREDGVKVPVFVYEHGVDKVWTPVDRKTDDEFIRFLHIGGEAARKGAQETMQAFRVAFANRDDVRLTIKMLNPGWNIPYVGKIHVINERMTETELIQLFHDHHVYVYPSYGEGFGLTPLQAIATGMPTITLPAWAPYREFLDPDLSVGSELKGSPWSKIHPGKMFRPDFDDLVDKMRYAADNYEKVQDFAHSRVQDIKAKYDWDKLTKNSFDALATRL